MEAAQGGEKEETKEEKVEQENEEKVEQENEEMGEKEKAKEEKALGRSREWATSCDKSVICDRGPGLVRLGSSLKVEERKEEEEEGEVEKERRRRRKMGEKEKGELRQTREGHRLSVVLPRQRARSPVTVQV